MRIRFDFGSLSLDAELLDTPTAQAIAGALPLLYSMAEGIVTGATYDPEKVPERGPAVPASGRRRSRLHEAVGYRPD